MVRDQRDQRLQKIESESTWFLNSYISRHLYNNLSLFTNKRAKSINFVTTTGQVIWIKEIGNVSIALTNNNKIELQNVALAPGGDSNLIFLGQLRETEITFYDDPTAMTLMRNGKIIAQAKRDQNLFILKLAQPKRAMTTIKTGSLLPKVIAIQKQD